MLNYFPSVTQNPAAPKIAKYAYGKDYHEVIKKNSISSCLNCVKISGNKWPPVLLIPRLCWSVVGQGEAALAGLAKTATLSAGRAVLSFIATLIVNIALQYDDVFAKIIAARAVSASMHVRPMPFWKTKLSMAVSVSAISLSN